MKLLFAKESFGEVCGEGKQLHERVGKAGRPGYTGRPACELCLSRGQFYTGIQDAAYGVVRQLMYAEWAGLLERST